MKNDFFCISLIIYSLIFVFCMFFQFYSYLKFKLLIKKSEAVSLMDNLYEITIYIVGFLYLAMYISSIADVFLNISRYENWKLPFIIYAMPLMVSTFNILVNEGLYGYSYNKLFVGRKKTFDWENVKIVGIYKHSFINRAKIIVTIDNAIRMKDRKFVIRTSLNNLQPFMKRYGK